LHGRRFDTTRWCTEVGALAAVLVGLFTFVAYTSCAGNRAAKAILFRGFAEGLFSVVVHAADSFMFYFRYKATQRITATEKLFLYSLIVVNILTYLGGQIVAPFYASMNHSDLSVWLLLMAVIIQCILIFYLSLRTIHFIFAILSPRRSGRITPETSFASFNLPRGFQDADDDDRELQETYPNQPQLKSIEMPWTRQLKLIAYKNIVHAVIALLFCILSYFAPDLTPPAYMIVRLLTMHLLFNCKYVDGWYFAWKRAKDGEDADKRPNRGLNRMQRENFVMRWARRGRDISSSVLVLFR
jgi:hypothetical protein